MTLKEISIARLQSQQLATSQFTSAKELVNWMGAMQAQDYAMAKWAIGARLPGVTNELIDKALDAGEIIRTHVLRPTWHFVAAEDLRWMMTLTAPHIKPLMKFHDRQLGLTESIYKKTNAIIEKALTTTIHLTRDELMALLNKARIRTDEYRSGHIMERAELDGIVCSGATKGNKLTYSLVANRVPSTMTITREEALIRLAERYFTSHGPATLTDSTWWSGLNSKDAAHALEKVKHQLTHTLFGTAKYWFPNSFIFPKKPKPAINLLPAFDEFLISYKDRSASLLLENQPKAFTNNGIFRPVIVHNGQVSGLWKRTIQKDKVIIEADFFKTPSQVAIKLAGKAAKTFRQFLGEKAELRF